jgi:cytidylate kinase
VVKDLYQKGDVVIIGRGANIILADTPDVIHIGLLAPLEVRAETLAQREHLEPEDARTYVEELEQARITFFRKYFQVHPNEPNLYHMMLNMAHMQPSTATDIIVSTVRSVAL